LQLLLRLDQVSGDDIIAIQASPDEGDVRTAVLIECDQMRQGIGFDQFAC
jgi:hypothetical protein